MLVQHEKLQLRLGVLGGYLLDKVSGVLGVLHDKSAYREAPLLSHEQARPVPPHSLLIGWESSTNFLSPA